MPPQGTGLTVNINFIDVPNDPDLIWSDEMKDAFIEGANHYTGLLSSPVPVLINAKINKNLPLGILAAASSTPAQNFPNAPLLNVVYPSALADKFATFDLNPGFPDIIVNVASNERMEAQGVSWNLESGTEIGDTEVSFTSIIIHEIGHGLLGTTSASVALDSEGNEFGFTSAPIVFLMDLFFQDCTTGETIADFVNNSFELGQFLQNDNLCWVPPSGIENICGIYGEIRMNAPDIVTPPGTINTANLANLAHLDENSYPIGDENSLMTPFINPGEVIESTGDLFRCMLDLIGWSIFLELKVGNDDKIEHSFSNLGSINISPNPTFGEVILNNYVHVIDMDYRIFNSIGKIEKSGRINELGQIDIGEMVNGLYFLQISDGKKIILNNNFTIFN